MSLPGGQKAQWCLAEKPVSIWGRGVTSDSICARWPPKAGQGTAAVAGLPRAEAGRSLVRAARLGRVGLAGGLGVSEGLLVERDPA